MVTQSDRVRRKIAPRSSPASDAIANAARDDAGGVSRWPAPEQRDERPTAARDPPLLSIHRQTRPRTTISSTAAAKMKSAIDTTKLAIVFAANETLVTWYQPRSAKIPTVALMIAAVP